MRERSPFRVGFTTGVMPDKWARVWSERVPERPLDLAPYDGFGSAGIVADVRSDDLQMGFVREPFDRDGLLVIPLYDEEPVVVVARDHPVAAYDEFDVAELTDDYDVAAEQPDISLRHQIEVVASGTGHLVWPKSVARVHQRKDVAVVPALGAATSKIGLTWRADFEDNDVETFIGIVRGRTARSSRG